MIIEINGASFHWQFDFDQSPNYLHNKQFFNFHIVSTSVIWFTIIYIKLYNSINYLAYLIIHLFKFYSICLHLEYLF